VRIGERDVDGAQQVRVRHLPPVGGHHVGGRGHAGGAAELGHDLPARVAVLGAARILGVGEQVAAPAAKRNRLGERPRAVGVDGDAARREAALQRGHRLHLLLAAHDAALELEIAEAVALDRGLGLGDDGGRRERGLVANAVPGLATRGLLEVGQVGTLAVADIKKVRKHAYRIPVAAASQQLAHRHPQKLSQQVQQRRLHGGEDVVHAQVDLVRLPENRRLGRRGHLVSRARPVPGDGTADGVERAMVAADLGADHERDRALERLADALAARYFADADVAGVVLEQHEVADEPGPVRPGQVEQHAVAPRDRDHPHPGDGRAARHLACLLVRFVVATGTGA
jgi:hypothetical protein